MMACETFVWRRNQAALVAVAAQSWEARPRRTGGQQAPRTSHDRTTILLCTARERRKDLFSLGE
jgi:hypothetical protein